MTSVFIAVTNSIKALLIQSLIKSINKILEKFISRHGKEFKMGLSECFSRQLFSSWKNWQVSRIRTARGKNRISSSVAPHGVLDSY